jgi:DNA-binding winged helix-turn-helix (wHTH) protein
LELLIAAKGSVRREKIIQAVWGKGGSPASLDKTIQRLREDLGAEGMRIQTTADGYELIG